MTKTSMTSQKLSAQEIQDEIFRKMSADQKLAVAAGLWRLGKELDADKIDYGTRNNRPKAASGQGRRDS